MNKRNGKKRQARKAFQLRAKGRPASGGITGCEGHHAIWSRLVFLDRTRAKAEIPAFIKRCCNPINQQDFYYLDPESITVMIVELDLIE